MGGGGTNTHDYGGSTSTSAASHSYRATPTKAFNERTSTENELLHNVYPVDLYV